MEEVIKVGIADWKLCKTPNKITTVGLGSCIGIVLYSKTSECCGLLHIMLPSSKEIRKNTNRAKFADTGIADLIAALEKQGVQRGSLVAKIAGGANMFQFATKSTEVGGVGERNIQAVKETLAFYKIPIVAEDIGEDYGRTVLFDPDSKKLTIHVAGRPDKSI